MSFIKYDMIKLLSFSACITSNNQSYVTFALFILELRIHADTKQLDKRRYS